ncbi:MAG: MerR family transcriptional regulator [Lachnospiraceae bacterium]|nr:MerR family transcriptional regulator [Lachnospiraceae bacterium]
MNTYTIRDLSQRFDVPSSTLRYYEDMGLLENVERTDNNQRIYTDEHIRRLEGINCFKKTGLPIARIQEFYQYEKDVDTHIEEIIQLVTEHESNIQNKIAELQQELLHIQHKVRFYNGIKEAIDAGQEPPKWEDFT